MPIIVMSTPVTSIAAALASTLAKQDVPGEFWTCPLPGLVKVTELLADFTDERLAELAGDNPQGDQLVFRAVLHERHGLHAGHRCDVCDLVVMEAQARDSIARNGHELTTHHCGCPHQERLPRVYVPHPATVKPAERALKLADGMTYDARPRVRGARGDGPTRATHFTRRY